MKLNFKKVPSTVKHAVIIIVLGLVATILRLPVEIQNNPDFNYLPENSVIIVIVMYGFWSLAKLIVSILLLYQFNWARITFLIFCLLGLPLSIKSLSVINYSFEISFSIGISTLLIIFCDYIALLYLFLKKSRNWFKSKNI